MTHSSPAPVPRARRPLQFAILEGAVVLAFYLVLTVVLTWPLAAQFATALPAGGDAWQHLWNLWWVKTALVDLHTNPFHTPYLYHPYGVDLYFHTLTPLLGVISIPLQLAGLDLLAVYNTLLALSFVVAGWGTYRLVVYLTGYRPGALVAGVIFAFAPYHVAHALGQLNLASVQWIPFYVLALVRAWDAGFPTREATDQPEASQPPTPKQGPPTSNPLRAAALAGLWLAVNAYTEWVYTLFLGLFTVAFVGWRLLVERRGPGWAAGLGRLVVLGGVFLLLTAPMLGPMLGEARAGGYVKAPPFDTLFYSSDLVDAFVPSPLHPWWGQIGQGVADFFVGRHAAERVVFVGYGVLALAGLALWWGRRQRAVLFWGATAAGAWLLSLGPILQIWGRDTFTIFAIKVPLPYLALYYVPFFNIFRAPARLNVLVMLALAVLAGYALAAFSRRAQSTTTSPVPRRASPARRLTPYIPVVIAGLLIITEFLSGPWPMVGPGYNVPFYRQVAQEPGDFALLELPLKPMSDYEAYQTVHHKPIIGGYLSRQPPDRFVAATPILRYLLPDTPVDDPLAAEAVRTGLADLRAAHVRYAIVHWWAFSEAERAAMQAKVARVFAGVPSQLVPEHQLEVWTLGP